MVVEIAEDMLTEAQAAEWAAYCEDDEAYSFNYEAYQECAAEAYQSFYGNCSDPTLTVGIAAREVGLVAPVAPKAPAFRPAWDAAPEPAATIQAIKAGYDDDCPF